MYKVMLVDDEPFILDGLKHIINWEEHGLEIVAEAINGIQAWNLIGQIPIQILILDIQMPQMNGLELLMKIREAELDIKCIILSGYDEFNFVKQASKLGIENYLLKPVNEEELSSTLLHSVELIENEITNKIKFRGDQNVLKETILYRWITNSISVSELIERSSQLNINLDCAQYLVCLMRNLKSKDGKGVQLDSIIRYAIINICNEIISDYGNSYVINDFNGDFVFLFSSNITSSGKKEIMELLNKCIQNINTLLKLDVLITIGSYETNLQMVHQSYQNAKSLIDYSLVLNPNSILDFEEHQKIQTHQQHTIEIDIENLTELISSRNLAGTLAFIDDLFASIGSLPNNSPDFLQNISIELLVHIFAISKQMKLDTSSLFIYSDSMYQTIFQFQDKNELANWLKQGIGKVIDHIPDKKVEDSNPLINRVLTYIEDNYANDISLKAISDKFKVNAAYLGQQFKKETGEMFSNYLNQLRIEKSKKLLLHSKLQANEIALQVGYTNANYFYETFKKITGVYPTKFKRES